MALQYQMVSSEEKNTNYTAERVMVRDVCVYTHVQVTTIKKRERKTMNLKEKRE